MIVYQIILDYLSTCANIYHHGYKAPLNVLPFLWASFCIVAFRCIINARILRLRAAGIRERTSDHR